MTDLPKPRPRPHSLAVRIARGLVLLLLSIAALLVVARWLAAPAVPDSFYFPLAPVSAGLGKLLRVEPFTRGIPAGARGWRILYSTARTDNAAAIASAIVVAPGGSATAPRHIVAWAHGTTGIAEGCAPSVMRKPFANVPAVEALLASDWVFVATDYVGLGTPGGHAYLVGEEAARAVLDSVRAAREMTEIQADNRFVVWGHSQGGNSALWTGMRAAAYAPELTLMGIAALAPASDLKALVHASQSTMFGKIVSAYLIEAYGASYPEIAKTEYLASGTDWLSRDIASRCVGDWGTLFSVVEAQALPSAGIFAKDPTTGALGNRLAQNTPVGPFSTAVLIAQGKSDDLVLPSVQDAYVAALCGSGQAVEYRTYEGRDHLSLVALDSPLNADLVSWTKERFDGQPGESGC